MAARVDCYVLRLGEDLRHGKLEVVRLWAPNAHGYVHAVEQAGVYTAENERRHNFGDFDALVPCALVEAVARKVRGKGGAIHVLPKREVARLVRGAARVAAYRASRLAAGGAP